MTKVKRGPSTASKLAEQHVAEHPGITAQELSQKFGINVTTIYRAHWWKNRNAAQAAQQSEGE